MTDPRDGAAGVASEGLPATVGGVLSGAAFPRLRLPRGPYFAIWPATVLLFAVSPLIAGGSDSTSALRSTLPFAAILAVVGIGQTLVIQQRGLDLSVPGVISLSAILVAKLPAGSDSGLLAAIVVVIAVSALTGLISGLAVTRLGITPLVATLGVNALVLGAILQITGGSSVASAPPALASFAFRRVLGVSYLLLIALALVAGVAFVIRRTTAGRRFVAIGTSAAAARAAGMPVRKYQMATYSIAAVCYGIAGVLVAGYLQTPGLSAGQSYLLPSIAAVVLGGTSLAGGGGSVLATAVGALFLTQLQQVVFGAGAPASVQLLIQSIAIGLGMALRSVRWRRPAPPGVPSSRKPV
ncbi:MAG TPA: ABC transporter permease [Streptosporangiaceae bacterium]|nr:ABC transporter permease [Streptosporangiaceae bacterium]